jgi:hypothetical protein
MWKDMRKHLTISLRSLILGLVASWAFASATLAQDSFNSPYQEMLLFSNRFEQTKGRNMILVPAVCLDHSLDPPEEGHLFDAFSNGIDVVRTMNGISETLPLSKATDHDHDWVQPKGMGTITEVGFFISPKQITLGATFELLVAVANPQFVATGKDQKDDIKKLMPLLDDVIAHADDIAHQFFLKYPLKREAAGKTDFKQRQWAKIGLVFSWEP